MSKGAKGLVVKIVENHGFGDGVDGAFDGVEGKVRSSTALESGLCESDGKRESDGMMVLKSSPDARVASEPNTGSHGKAMEILHHGNPNWRMRSTDNPTKPPRMAAN